MSEFRSQWYVIDETLGRIDALCAEDVRMAVTDLEALRDKTQEKHDNMPDSLQQGSTGEQLEGRVDACDQAISELEDIASRMDDTAEDDDTTNSESMEDLQTEAREVLSSHEPD